MTPRVDQADFRVHRFPPKYLRQSKYVFEVSPTIVPHILRSKRPECTRMRLRANDSAARRDIQRANRGRRIKCCRRAGGAKVPTLFKS